MAQQPEVRQASIVAHGRIEGNTSVLDEPVGLADGAEVDVSIRAAAAPAEAAGGSRRRDEVWSDPVIGMWADRDDLADPVAWVKERRSAWRKRLNPDT
ncbi:MAG: hypothetical protein HYU66_03580 [Armatimonadetes bacterium]|nr:hypothetical protein [Armatimonadota bacterium]